MRRYRNASAITMTHDALDRAYHATTYIVDAPGGPIALRIGELNEPLDALLRTLDAGPWAFITAWNPGSGVLSAAENDARNGTLKQEILRAGYDPLEGRGEADDGGWTAEASFFIVGISPADAAALARQFGQRAIVVGERGRAPALLMCGV